MRRLAILAAGVVAAVGLSTHQAKAQTQVTCESVNGRQRVCAMDTRGGVQLTRYLSLTPCVQGQNWGIARGGVWVSGGCRGEFRTAGVATGSGRYNNSGRYNDNGRYNNSNTYDPWGNPTGNGNTWNSRSLATIDNLCRNAVRQRVGNRRLSTQLRNNSRNNARIDWQSSNGHAGSCRVDRNGNVSLSIAR